MKKSQPFGRMNASMVSASSRPRTPPMESADDLDDHLITIVNTVVSNSEGEDELLVVRNLFYP